MHKERNALTVTLSGLSDAVPLSVLGGQPARSHLWWTGHTCFLCLYHFFVTLALRRRQ